MIAVLAYVHIFIGLGLVLFVLLQDPKGGAMGVFSGGGGSNTFFGSSGATNFLTKTTRWLAILFAISCLTLTYYSARKGGSVMDNLAPSSLPVTPTESSAPANPGAGAPVDAASPATATPPAPADAGKK